MANPQQTAPAGGPSNASMDNRLHMSSLVANQSSNVVRNVEQRRVQNASASSRNLPTATGAAAGAGMPAQLTHKEVNDKCQLMKHITSVIGAFNVKLTKEAKYELVEEAFGPATPHLPESSSPAMLAARCVDR